MVSALVSRSSDPGLNPSRGYCVVFLGKILHFHSATPHKGVQMVGIGELNDGGITLQWTSLPSRGEKKYS